MKAVIDRPDHWKVLIVAASALLVTLSWLLTGHPLFASSWVMNMSFIHWFIFVFKISFQIGVVLFWTTMTALMSLHFLIPSIVMITFPAANGRLFTALDRHSWSNNGLVVVPYRRYTFEKYLSVLLTPIRHLFYLPWKYPFIPQRVALGTTNELNSYSLCNKLSAAASVLKVLCYMGV